jgi:hypothetical protein
MRLTRYTLLLLWVLPICSCEFSGKGQKVKETIEFVNFLKENKEQEVYSNTYHVDYNITDSEIRKYQVKKACQLIQKYGLPTTDKWAYSYNPNNNFDRYQFRIPLFDGFDSTNNLLHAAIIISFPPPAISTKIYSYDIETRFKISKIESVPSQPSTDSTR